VSSSRRWALGLAVVATAVGGIPDVIVDGECGRLVEPESPDALAAALIELGRDPGLRSKLGEAAETRAEAFSTAWQPKSFSRCTRRWSATRSSDDSPRGAADRRRVAPLGRRSRARAAAGRPPRAFRPLHRRFLPRAADRDGREAGDRRAAPHRELPPARRVRPAAVQSADPRGARRALGARRRHRSLSEPGRAGARREPARADRPGRGGAAALLLDGSPLALRHDSARDAEEHAGLRPRRWRAARPAGDRQPDRRVRLVVGARRAARRAPDSGGLSAHAQAARAPQGRTSRGGGQAASLARRLRPVRGRRRRARTRLARSPSTRTRRTTTSAWRRIRT
jgi:hypothetical protein